MIQESFQRDHEEIDEIVNVFRRDLGVAIEKGAVGNSSLVQQFEEFNRRLERHIRWEEEILFPAVERENPQLQEGPGRVMRMEHVEIRDLKAKALNELKQALVEPASLPKANNFLEQAIFILKNHNMKEENIYYPMADQMLSESEKKEILEKTVHLKS